HTRRIMTVHRLQLSPDARTLVLLLSSESYRSTPQADVGRGPRQEPHPQWHVIAWDVRARRSLAEFRAEPSVMAFSSDNRYLAFDYGNSLLRLLEPETARLYEVATGHHQISALLFSLDGRTLYSGGREGSILVWDVPTLLKHPRLIRD